jgi:hypothetical protein
MTESIVVESVTMPLYTCVKNPFYISERRLTLFLRHYIEPFILIDFVINLYDYYAL